MKFFVVEIFVEKKINYQINCVKADHLEFAVRVALSSVALLALLPRISAVCVARYVDKHYRVKFELFYFFKVVHTITLSKKNTILNK